MRTPLVFPIQTLSDQDGLDLIRTLMPPISGAVLLLLFAFRPPMKVKFTLAGFVSIEAFFAVLFGSGDLFVLSPYAVAAIVASIVGIAAVVRPRFKSDRILFGAAALIPAAFLLYALITGTLLAAYLWPVKAAVALFATSAQGAVCISRLLRR